MTLRTFISVSLAALLTAAVAGFSSRAAERPPVMGRKAGISAGHPLTTAADFEVLTRGGNAFDAGVVALLVRGVVEQDYYSLGGEALVLVYPRSIGKVVACTQARIMDVETGTRELPDGEPGEIVIKGPQVMKGYWQKPEETARVLRRGWLYTGDIAKRDADGFFYIVDRKKDLIIAGGFNIYPRDVEEVLFEHPRIQANDLFGLI